MKILLALALAFLLNIPANAQTTDQFVFAKTAVEIYVEMRESQNQPMQPESLEGIDILRFHLKNLVRQGNVYRRQALRVDKYKKSNDEGIRQATVLLASGIFMIQSTNANLVAYLETVLNNPKLMLQQGTVTRKMAEFTDAMDTAWQTYAETAASGVTFALMNTPRSLKDLSKSPNEPVTKLLITKPEIELLDSLLLTSFSTVLADHNKAKWADVPAITLWDFLHDKWTPAPE